MDPGGPGSRAGRTFWTFWVIFKHSFLSFVTYIPPLLLMRIKCIKNRDTWNLQYLTKNYITDIVGRFLRPEPRGTEINDTDKTNLTPTNDEPLDSCHKIHTTTEEGEEVHVVLASSVGSTRPVVLWDTGSELQPEISQNVLQEHEKINENNDGKREEEIETGIDAASYLPISTTMDNPEQSCDITINDEELMPKILVDSRDEMIDRDIEVCSEGDKPQSKEQPNEISKSFNEQNTYSEITSELDTITVEQKHCEQHDEKLRLNDNMDLDESAQIIEKQENVEVDGNVKSECGGNKNAEKGAEEKEIKIEMCLQTTHLEVTRQNDVTDRSNEMNNEDMNRPHTLVLEAEKLCKQDNMSEVFESSKDEHYNDNMTNQNAMFDTEDGDDVKECKECPVLCTIDDSANVKSENDEKENEIQKEEIEIKENDNDHMTNQNTTFDTGDGDNANTSLVLETENMNKQDDKNVVHGGNKDDMVMTQNNPDMGNLERLSDVGSSVSDKDHVNVLEEDEKQELTVANTTDANVKLENYEKEKEIQKEEIEITENDNDQDRDQDMTQQCTLEVADDENSIEESTNEDDLNKLHMSLVLETENRSKQDDKKEDEKQELTVTNTADESANVKSENDEKESEIQKEESEITEHYNDNMTNQNAVSDTEDGDNAKETCPALILDQDMTQQYTLEVVDNESSTEESKDMNEDDLNKLHTLVLETENMIKEDDKNEVHDGNKDVLVMTQNNPDMGNLEISCHCADKDRVIVLEEDEKQEFTVSNTTDDTAIVKSENDEKGKEIQKEDSEITKQYDNMTTQNAMFDTEDGDDIKEYKECPVLCTIDDSANVKSENDEKENEIQKEEIEIKENDNDHMTNQNTPFDTGDGDNANTSLVLETENMNKQDDKNVVHGGNKDDMVMTQNNPDMGNLERLSDVGSSASDKDHVNVLEEDEKQELTVANTTDANVKLENYEKEKEIQKEEIEITENDNDQDRDQDMTQQCTLEVADDENSIEESTNEDDLNKLHMSLVLETENRSKQDDKKEDEKQELTVANTADDSANVKSENDEKESEIQKEESEITEHYNDNMTNQNAVSDTEDGDNAKETCPALILDQDMTQQYTLEVVDNESSTEESKDMNEDDLNKLHTLVLETENMIKEDDKNEVHDGNKDVLVMTQNNPDMGNLEISCHCADKDRVIVLEEDEKQEFTVSNTTDDTAIVKSENYEKGKEIQKEDSEITKQYDNMTTQNAMADIEYGDSAKETCPVLNIDQDMSHPHSKSSTEQSKDMNKDYLNKLHIFGGLETETLSILDNQDEYNKEQVTDERVIIQEVEPSTSKQEYTAANGNEESYDNRENKKPGNMEQDISEEESDNNDSKTKVIRSNMDDSANVGLETVSRCDLDLESFFSIAHPASSEMDSSMGKFCVTIKNEGGPTQEQVIAFKNIPPGEGEGQEHPYSYKESREEVPDCNNECNNQSATQSFLEVGNCRENQTTLLQEEVESRAVQRLQNSGTSEGEDTLGDLMETELIQNSLEEHIADTHLPDNLMKTGSEYTNFETNFVSEEVKEKEDDLKEAEREIGFEMGKGLCDTDSVKDGLETGFQNCIFLDQNECNIQTVERPFVELQTTEMDLSAIEEGFFTSEEEATVVKSIIDGSSESVKSGSVNEDVDVHEHCTTGSNDNVMPDVVHHEISVNALSVKDEHQKCVLQHQIFDDVIEDEILDLWIRHTSDESSEVREGDQGHEDSQRDLPEEEKIESIPELSITCDVSLSLSVTESGFFDLSMDMGSIQHECNEEAKELPKEEEIINVSCALNKSEDLSESSIAELELETAWREDMGTTPKSTNDGEEAITSQNIDSIMSMLTPVMQDNSQFSIQTDYQPFTTSGMLSEPETLSKDQSDSLSEIKNRFDTTVTSETKVYQSLLQDKLKVEALQESEVEDINKVNISEFDFTPQKSRIAVKNPRVRPPKDFRSLLHKPSLEPSPSKPLASCVPAGVPMGGLGIGIKLPGLGTGFPVLKKTRKTIEEETKTTTRETKPMLEEEDKLKPEDSQQRPKWMPPNQPGFGNPLMSELKSKLKKTTKE